MIPKDSYIIIQNVHPLIDAGRYPAKRELGEAIRISAEVFREGHDVIRAELCWRKEGLEDWQRQPMLHVNPGLDLFETHITPCEIGRHEFKIEAYTDHYASWLHECRPKHEAGQTMESEAIEGLHLVQAASRRATNEDAAWLKERLEDIKHRPSPREQVATMFAEDLCAVVMRYPLRKGVETGASPAFPLYINRVKARYASWYEVFPRSTGQDSTRSATWGDVERFLPYVADLGFDVLYFPPIHPIGKSFKKGRNNSLYATPEDPGCPYAIGNEHGGHFAVCELLGTMEEFEHMVRKASEYGIEIAIDFAINCSYDHPYLKEHPDWFYRRPDGTIKYAENPPKKYEDIYPLNFDCKDRDALWNEMRHYFLFWAKKGVRIFRVDNPHTKPIIFWEWVIREVQQEFPDVIFLSEAFTRPRRMEMLAKVGFTQSYTYFTWRQDKDELREYFEHLTGDEVAEYMRGNLFPTTPDILPPHLHHSSPAYFKARLALAATLSSVYGMYSGYEFCENEPFPGKEELNHSEKYEFKVRDWAQTGIRPFVRALNQARRVHPALQEYRNLRFIKTENDQILGYVKSVGEGYGQNIIIVLVNLDPWQTQVSNVFFPLVEYGFDWRTPYAVHDQITRNSYLWKGEKNYVELTPENPVHVFHVTGI